MIALAILLFQFKKFIIMFSIPVESEEHGFPLGEKNIIPTSTPTQVQSSSTFLNKFFLFKKAKERASFDSINFISIFCLLDPTSIGKSNG